jgi:hypothetical protein
MEYRKFGSDYVVRLQKGEEIVESIRRLCETEHIRLASLSGLGAVGHAVLGVFNSQKFAYETNEFTGDFEIASCTGNITTMDGKTYLHLHICIANPTLGLCHGGHLTAGTISLTGEFILHAIDGTVEREYSPEVGLNLFKFED